jgi:two-component system OmpR family response regulator
VTATIASTLHIPSLAEAAHVRGLRLVPFGSGVEAQAALFGCCAEGIAEVRARGWDGPLMLVLPEGASVAHALDAGADDAVAHPASASEIAARLAARLRHRPVPLTLGPLRIDPVERRVTRDGRPIQLLPREYALLLHLARQPGRCASRAELLAAVWGLRFDPGTNVVEVHVSRLRAKLDRGHAAPMLATEKGRGYRLNAA